MSVVRPKYDLKNRFNAYASNIKSGLKESFNYIASAPERFKKKSLKGKLVSVFKLATIPGAIYLGSNLPLAAQILGPMALASTYVINRLKDNSHLNALMPPVLLSAGTQHFMLGASGAAIMSSLGCLRMVTMSMFPHDESSQALRNKVALGFATVGTIGIGALVITQSLWNLIPLTSMGLYTFASSRTDDKSHQARAAYGSASFLNSIFSSLYTGSPATAMQDLAFLANAAQTSVENDIPKQKDLTRLEKCKGYLSSLWTGVSCNKKQIPEDTKLLVITKPANTFRNDL